MRHLSTDLFAFVISKSHNAERSHHTDWSSSGNGKHQASVLGDRLAMGEDLVSPPGSCFLV